MPTYEYLCEACGNEFEKFHSMSAAPVKVCPSCGKKKVIRKIGIGAGIIFKGGGFYETDYRSEAYKKSVDAEKGGGEAKPSETKTDAAKTESVTPAAESKPTEPAPAAKPKSAAKAKDKK